MDETETEKRAIITVPVKNESVNQKTVNVVMAVFDKDNKLDSIYEVKRISKDIDRLEDITITDLIPNDNKHKVILLVYDTMDNIQAFEMETIKK